MPLKYTSKALESFHKQIGYNVKKAREAKGITQLELSQRLGYKSQSVISKAEKCIEGKHFGIDHLFVIANELEVDICELVRVTPSR